MLEGGSRTGFSVHTFLMWEPSAFWDLVWIKARPHTHTHARTRPVQCYTENVYIIIADFNGICKPDIYNPYFCFFTFHAFNSIVFVPFLGSQ